jgi:hypothetical protein
MEIEVKKIMLSRSCEQCTFQLREKCEKAFRNCDRRYFVHCNTENCNLLKDLGL